MFPLTGGNGRTTGTQKPSIQAYRTPTRTAIEETLFPVSWKEMTSLSRQQRVPLPTPKACRRANPWRFGPERPSPVLNLL